MNFRRGQPREEPEINLIPMIDVLLVILIFLMVTTRFNLERGLHITLPRSQAASSHTVNNRWIEVQIQSSGQIWIGSRKQDNPSRPTLQQELRAAAAGQEDPVVLIRADQQATHGQVMAVLEAAQALGYRRITFSTQPVTDTSPP